LAAPLPALSAETLDVSIVRASIERSLRSRLERFRGTVLDVGAGNQPYRQLLLDPPSKAAKYVALDLAASVYSSPDLVWDGVTMPLESESVACALATELFEHCPDPELVMREIFRVLEPGGFLFFSVPFLWPLHDVPADEYRYTPFSLRRHLTGSGFVDVELDALGGWDASLAQMLALWARRRPMSTRTRRLLSAAALPVIRGLLARDRPPTEFADGAMLTGLAGTASKPSR